MKKNGERFAGMKKNLEKENGSGRTEWKKRGKKHGEKL